MDTYIAHNSLSKEPVNFIGPLVVRHPRESNIRIIMTHTYIGAFGIATQKNLLQFFTSGIKYIRKSLKKNN